MELTDWAAGCQGDPGLSKVTGGAGALTATGSCSTQLAQHLRVYTQEPARAVPRQGEMLGWSKALSGQEPGTLKHGVSISRGYVQNTAAALGEAPEVLAEPEDGARVTDSLVNAETLGA